MNVGGEKVKTGSLKLSVIRFVFMLPVELKLL